MNNKSTKHDRVHTRGEVLSYRGERQSTVLVLCHTLPLPKGAQGANKEKKWGAASAKGGHSVTTSDRCDFENNSRMLRNYCEITARFLRDNCEISSR